MLGAVVRHRLHNPSAVRLHVLNAFAVTAGVVWLLRTAWERPAGRRVLGRPLVVMAALLVLQLSLGVEALLGQYASDLPLEAQPIRIGVAAVRTAHVVVGAFLLAAAAVAAVQAYRAAVALPVEEPAAAANQAAAEGVYAGVPRSQQVRGNGMKAIVSNASATRRHAPLAAAHDRRFRGKRRRPGRGSPTTSN